MALLAVSTASVFMYSLISRRLERTVVMAPIALTAPGILVSLILLEMQERRMGSEAFLRLAAMVTVLLSTFAHGLGAMPGMGL